MITVVLYGRNDSYGYNLHKRATLSINTIAEILSHKDDEIIFVDYNTVDDFPTFPESIRDLLTEKAKAKLRILRVRSSVHNELFFHKTHLMTLEAVARNVAVRRSNPSNKWILSTNTDMIFIPRVKNTLTDICSTLDNGYYCIPRFEIPEGVWEVFDRLNPAHVISGLLDISQSLHLQEIVYADKGILFDAPGDFQLMLRSDIFKINGFNEEMTSGWHVDSNIALRLRTFYPEVLDLSSQIWGYHCSHTRQITPSHKTNAKANNLYKFAYSVSDPYLPNQSKTWGLANYDIEEFSLDKSKTQNNYIANLRAAIGGMQKQPIISSYTIDKHNSSSTSAQHILPFLVDSIENYHKDISILWIGQKDELYNMLTSVIKKLKFKNIVTDMGSCKSTEKCDVVMINFGILKIVKGKKKLELQRCLHAVMMQEIKKIKNTGRSTKLTKFIGINAHNTSWHRLFISYVNSPQIPFCTHILCGHIKPALQNNPIVLSRLKLYVSKIRLMIQEELKIKAPTLYCRLLIYYKRFFVK